MKKIKHGDTIVEVCICVAIFAIVCIVTIGMMNNGLNLAQRSLEVTMARTAIDSQAEALRFIHNNYLSERNYANDVSLSTGTASLEVSQFKKIWERIKDYSRDPSSIRNGEYVSHPFSVEQFVDANGNVSCGDAMKDQADYFSAFIVNPRLIVPDLGASYRGVSYTDMSSTGIIDNMIFRAKSGNMFKEAPLYPRIIYRRQNGISNSDVDNLKGENTDLFQFINTVEGLWVVSVHENSADINRSEYFDFYIRTCWTPVGSSNVSTITTVIRLYNPETIQE